MYFDSHAHYDDEAFDADRDELLAALPEHGVGLVVIPGQNQSASEAAISLAERHPHVYAAVGWHPHEADSFPEDGIDRMRRWAEHPKVVALGEMGLDYHYDFSPRDVQRRVLEEQLYLAEELRMPVVMHDREAHGDMLDIVRRHPAVQGVFHCWSGSPEMAEELLSLGWYISFTGSITFKNNRRGLETVALMPDDRFMLETDAPYLTPVPHRGKRNDSTFLPFVARTVAEVRGYTVEQVERLSWENGKRFYGIK